MGLFWRIGFFSTLLFVFSGYLQGVVYEAKSLDPVRKEVELVDAGTLVVFDVDDVVITPSALILRPRNNSYKQKLKEKYFAQVDLLRVIDLTCIVLVKDNMFTLVDESLPNLMNAIRSKEGKILALTATVRGKFGSINSLEDWKTKILDDHHIDFQANFQNVQPFTLNDKCFKQAPPLFKKGILFSDPYPKGVVLKSFLDRMNFRPTKVIFIDDTMENIESVGWAMEEKHIPYVGFHYTAVNELPNDIREDVIDLQFRHLIENEVWLSDEEASQQLQNL